MKNIICIVGKTSSGKDTTARYIEKAFGIKPICSYTTRPMRNGETEGVQHYFITPEQSKKIREKELVLAYTILNGNEYFSTVEGMTEETMSYIINPEGIDYLRQHSGDYKFVSIYVHIPERVIMQRALVRGDSFKAVENRLSDEREQFSDFYNNSKYDFLITNDAGEDELHNQIDDIMSSLGYGKIQR